MRTFLLLLATLTAWGCSPAPDVPAEPAAATVRIDVAREAAEKPSVFSSQIAGYGLEAEGAGVLIDESGLVLSVAHLFAPSDAAIWVTTSDGHIFYALLTSKNEDLDLALLQLESTPEMLRDLPTLSISEDQSLKPGDPLLAFQGFDEMHRPRFSEGGVLALGQAIEAGKPLLERPLSNLIQFNLAVTDGYSGGPITNLRGEVVGIISAGRKDAAEGYAISVFGRTLDKLFDI